MNGNIPIPDYKQPKRLAKQIGNALAYWRGDEDADKRAELYRRIAQTKAEYEPADLPFQPNVFAQRLFDMLFDTIARAAASDMPEETKENVCFSDFAHALSRLQVIGCYEHAKRHGLTNMSWDEWFTRHTAYLEDIQYEEKMTLIMTVQADISEWSVLLQQ